MKSNYLKYKIVYQSKENIWGKYNHRQKFKKQKWTKIIKKLDRVRKFHFYRRPRSSRALSRQRLLAKQTFQHFYGNVSYTKLKKEYRQIQKTMVFDPIQTLMISLEGRLDIFLFRSNLFLSILEAKQAILHNQVCVNHQMVSKGNYRLKSGDFIQLRDTNLPKSTIQLPYSQINVALNLLIFLRNPTIQEIRYPFPLNVNFLTNYLNKK